MAFDTFYYDGQIKRYLVQFMSIFSAMQVITGKRDDNEPQLIKVPIHYGNKDRVVAHILADNTQNKLLRLPIMSANLTAIDLAPELRKGVGGERRQTYMPRGEVFPDDLKTVHQLMPIPYRARAEIAIMSSNTEQKLQILEQILMIFDPSIQLQTSDALLDWTKLTTVELDNIGIEENYPTGTDRRILVTVLSFNFPIYIAAPSNIKSEYIKEIFVRIGVVSQNVDLSNSAEVVGDLDGQGLEYEKWFTLDDVDL